MGRDKYSLEKNARDRIQETENVVRDEVSDIEDLITWTRLGKNDLANRNSLEQWHGITAWKALRAQDKLTIILTLPDGFLEACRGL